MTELGPQFAFLTRASYQVVQTADATLHLGVNYANLFAPRVQANEDAIELFDRPELRVDPSYFLNTGYIPATGGQVYGAEAAASLYNFFVQGEYYHYVVDSRAGVTARPGNLQGGLAGPNSQFRWRLCRGELLLRRQAALRSARGAYTGVIPQGLGPG